MEGLMTEHPISEILGLISGEEDESKWYVVNKGPRNLIQTESSEEEALSQQVFLIKNKEWPEVINYFYELEKTFGFFYKGFGIQKSQKVILNKISLIEEESKFRKNREKSEPNPPEDNSDILETDSDPEEVED